jgi:hypothetical protein
MKNALDCNTYLNNSNLYSVTDFLPDREQILSSLQGPFSGNFKGNNG